MKKEKIEITLEDAQPKDAKALLDFYKIVGGETPFLSFGPEGLGLNQEQEQRYLKSIAETDNNRILIAKLEGEIIGVASIGAEQNPAISHVGEIGIAILRKFWGFGLSRVMMEDMLDWAAENPALRYLRLEVHAENIRAIKLYEKYDFVQIGVTPGGIYKEGEYADLIMMGCPVTAEPA